MKIQRNIFRAEALQHYLHKRQADVLPRLIAPSFFLVLWVILGLLLGGLMVMLVVMSQGL